MFFPYHCSSTLIALAIWLFLTTPLEKGITENDQASIEKKITTPKEQEKALTDPPKKKKKKSSALSIYLIVAAISVVLIVLLVYFILLPNKRAYEPFPIVGLPRVGLTCYMDAALQVALAVCYSLGDPALKLIHSCSQLRPNSPEEEIAIAFSELLYAVEQTGSNGANPQKLNKKYLRKLLKKMGAMYDKYKSASTQNDSREFLLDLFNNIDEALRKQTPQEGKSNHYHDLAKVEQLNSYLSAGYEKLSMQRFKKQFLAYKNLIERSQLSPFARLYMYYNSSPSLYLDRENKKKKHIFSLYPGHSLSINEGKVNDLNTLLQEVTYYDVADPIWDEEYKKMTRIKRLSNSIGILPPPILLLSIANPNLIKGNTKLVYPLSGLVVNDDERNTYDLAAIIIHIDKWGGVPHYVALIQDRERGKWYEANDDHIREVTTDYVADHTQQTDYFGSLAKPTLLVYRKRNAFDQQEKVEDIVDQFLVKQSLRRLAYREGGSWVKGEEEMRQLWAIWNSKNIRGQHNQELLQSLKKSLLVIASHPAEMVAEKIETFKKSHQEILPIFAEMETLFQEKNYLQEDTLTDTIYGYLDFTDYCLYQEGYYIRPDL